MGNNNPPSNIDKKNKVDDKALLNIEAALNLIPIAGGFLATYFSEIRGKRLQERMKKYFIFFTERLKEIEQNNIDKKYMKSEEFAELFLKGAEQAARSSTEKKIKRFADILVNNVLVDSKSRYRTESIISFVDRLSDLDIIILVAYGQPFEVSMRASCKDEIVLFVKKMALFLGLSVSNPEAVIESVIYMDNLGLTWVNEDHIDENIEKGEGLILKEFSSFRTPLGNEVVKVIVPPDFFVENKRNSKKDWPKNIIKAKYKNSACL